jgi:alpha-galactosidase
MSRLSAPSLAFVIACVASICIQAQVTPPVRSTGAATAPDLSGKILTPPAPKAPRINGPSVYGQRPGRPFLYNVPATGARPTKFAAKGLPEGLKIDENIGRITGVVKAPGEFDVTLVAKNDAGSAEKKFRIKIGDTIGLTPAMGWNSWNVWAEAVDQDKCLRAAKAFARFGLKDHGWTFVNIDENWQGDRDPKTHALQPSDKFPDLKAYCDEVHAMGLKAGIYSTPWKTSYSGNRGGSADDAEGTWVRPTTRYVGLDDKPGSPWSIGKISFADADARQFAEWGFDYLKYDWRPNRESETREMAEALKASGRDIIYSLSNSTPFDSAAMVAKYANSWRTTGDIRDTWWSIATIGFAQDRWAPFAGPGHFNDPDMLVVGYLGWSNKLHYTNLTADEQYTHISLWCLLSAPLLLGCDLDKLDPFTLNLLTNDEVLAIDQDALAKPARLVSTQGGDVTLHHPTSTRTKPRNLPRGQVWLKELEDGSHAIGLFNLGDEPMKVKADFAELKLEGKQSVRDLWRQKDLGNFENAFEPEVPPHGVVLVKLTAQK